MTTWCIKYNKTNSASSTVSLLQLKHWHQDLPFFSDRCRSLGSYFKWPIQSSWVTKSETFYSDLDALFQTTPLIRCSGWENTDKRFLLHHNHNQNDHGHIKGLHFNSSLCARVSIKHDPLSQNNVDTCHVDKWCIVQCLKVNAHDEISTNALLSNDRQ